MRFKMKSALTATLTLSQLAAACLGGCAKAPAPMTMPPPQVAVVTAHAQEVPLVRDLVGRLSATRQSDVRARVAGVLLKRVYTEGADVKQGQTLFLIDPNPLKAALDAALANLASPRQPPPTQKCSRNGPSISHPSTIFPRMTSIMRAPTIAPRPRPYSSTRRMWSSRASTSVTPM
jgi:hypothetical protein